MPDNEVRLRIQLEGRSLDDLKAELKKAKADLGKALIGSDTFAEANKNVIAYKNAIHSVSVQSYSDNAKMKESYFQVGEELRRFYRDQRLQARTFREVSGAVGGLGDAFGMNSGLSKGLTSALGQFDQMEFAVNGLSIAAQGAGGKLAAIGGALMSVALPVTIAGAAFMGLSSWIRETYEATEKLIEKQKELQDKLNPKALVDQLKDARASVDAARSKLEKSRPSAAMQSVTGWLSGLGAASTVEGLAGGVVASAFGQSQYNKILENENKIAEAQIKEKGIVKAMYDERIAQADALDKLQDDAHKKELARIAKEEQTWVDAYQLVHEMTGKAIGETARTRASSGRMAKNWPTKLQGVEGVSPVSLAAEEVKISFAEIIHASGIMQDSIAHGFQAVGNAVYNGVAGGLSRAFGEAKSLLQIFITDVVASFAGMATQLMGQGLFKGLLSLLSGGGFLSGFLSVFGMAGGGVINEPIFGVGQSGRAYMFGEKGPERVSPINNMRGGASSQSVTVIHKFAPFKMHGNDLVAIHEKSATLRKEFVYGS